MENFELTFHTSWVIEKKKVFMTIYTLSSFVRSIVSNYWNNARMLLGAGLVLFSFETLYAFMCRHVFSFIVTIFPSTASESVLLLNGKALLFQPLWFFDNCVGSKVVLMLTGLRTQFFPLEYAQENIGIVKVLVFSAVQFLGLCVHAAFYFGLITLALRISVGRTVSWRDVVISMAGIRACFSAAVVSLVGLLPFWLISSLFLLQPCSCSDSWCIVLLLLYGMLFSLWLVRFLLSIFYAADCQTSAVSSYKMATCLMSGIRFQVISLLFMSVLVVFSSVAVCMPLVVSLMLHANDVPTLEVTMAFYKIVIVPIITLMIAQFYVSLSQAKPGC